MHSRSDIDLIVIRPTGKLFLHRADDLISLLPPGIPVDMLVYIPWKWEHLRHHRSFHHLAEEQGQRPSGEIVAELAGMRSILIQRLRR
ncbi:MAG: hypothetical protein ACOYEN_04515 [Limnochordia bacterium]